MHITGWWWGQGHLNDDQNYRKNTMHEPIACHWQHYIKYVDIFGESRHYSTNWCRVKKRHGTSEHPM